MSTFALPDLGEGLQEAEIVSWHVAEGDHVVVDQPLVAVETEKAVVEVPSPQAGHVAKLLAKEGERVKVGAPILRFEEGRHPDSSTVVGDLGPSAVAGAASAGLLRASPAVRARAKELGVDLASVTPTGPGGTIALADVQAAASQAAAGAGAGALRGARRTMAVNMARAWREVAHATLHDDADIEAWPTTEDFMCRLIRAVIAGCKNEPSLNASFDAAAFALRANSTVDLGIAIDGPEGLFVPVLRDAAGGWAVDWRQKIDAFKRGVQERSLTPADLRAPTITLSNFGSIAGRHSSLIVMPPQVAILGAGRVAVQPVRTADGGVALHRAMPLSLSFDHRAITGGMAARFLRAVLSDLAAAL
jgi:2-oxoisovalerate dehydrogenase E2 component (dihydrolipoyl transacylase)